jgi:hypothetical protein
VVQGHNSVAELIRISAGRRRRPQQFAAVSAIGPNVNARRRSGSDRRPYRNRAPRIAASPGRPLARGDPARVSVPWHRATNSGSRDLAAPWIGNPVIPGLRSRARNDGGGVARASAPRSVALHEPDVLALLWVGDLGGLTLRHPRQTDPDRRKSARNQSALSKLFAAIMPNTKIDRIDLSDRMNRRRP